MQRNGSETSSTADTSPAETLTSDQSLTCAPMTCAVTINATFSPGSEDGRAVSGLPDGTIMLLHSPPPVLVSRFRALESGKAMPTSDTSGPLFTASSPSARLQLSLENRLRALMDVNGSLEYALTWKYWDMPAGPPICALRASGRRKSDSGFIGWPTVRAADRGPRNPETARRKLKSDGRTRHHRIEDLLTALGTVIGYPNPTFLSWLMGFPTSWEESAPSAMRSTRTSRHNSLLRPTRQRP